MKLPLISSCNKLCLESIYLFLKIGNKFLQLSETSFVRCNLALHRSIGLVVIFLYDLDLAIGVSQSFVVLSQQSG